MNEKSWLDGLAKCQIRTFGSRRLFQINVLLDNMHNDGFLHVSVHLFKRALAFECPIKSTRTLRWKLFN